MATVLFALPNCDFDPTEAGVPWRVLRQRGHRVIFATPEGKIARADPRLITGEGLGFLSGFMKADNNGRLAYEDMSSSGEFQHPVSHREIPTADLDALILPGGHAPGMRPYLESNQLQSIVTEFFERNLPVGAICHGVLLAARSKAADGKSVLSGRKTTALTKIMELTAWTFTCLYLGSYYRTYPTTVEDEVRAALAAPEHFIRGPIISIRRDSPDNLTAGFTVRDGNYLSARWPGDSHRFAHDFVAMLG